jgi:hypothetical protein
MPMSVEPAINFSIHEVRANTAGATKDFEQMLGLLVQATQGEAHLVSANPGDWGIDVFVGELDGKVTIWQAKYFIHKFGDSQKKAVRNSFASAVEHAATKGYVVARWILCIPSSMDGPATRWWYRWRAKMHQKTGVIVDLWDENTLRQLLLDKKAAEVRRHYYNPYRHDVADDNGEPRDPTTGPAGASRPRATRRAGGLARTAVVAAVLTVIAILSTAIIHLPAATSSLPTACRGDTLLADVRPDSTHPPQGAPLRIRVGLTNASARPCSRTVGTDNLNVQVRQNGNSIWSSTTCLNTKGKIPRGIGSIISFAPSQRQEFQVTWDGTAGTTQNCSGARPTAKAGSYTVRALLDGRDAGSPIGIQVGS